MANWLDLKGMQAWEGFVLRGFQYDRVLDSDIREALGDSEAMSRIRTNSDWQDDSWLAGNKRIPEGRKHAYRIAALVHELQNGGTLRSAVELDTFMAGRCLSAIPDGHHRLRALQFLGFKEAPFSLSGRMDELEDLVALAGVPLPIGVPYTTYFSTELLSQSQFDVPARS